MRPAYLALMKALISLGATAHRGAIAAPRCGQAFAFRSMEILLRVLESLEDLGLSGAGADPKEDWEDWEDWFLKDKREEDKEKTPQKRMQE